MKKFVALSMTSLMFQTCLSLTLLPAGATAQTAQTAVAAQVKQPTASLAFGLPDGTPVKLRLSRTMSSADAKTGETVDFEVLEDVKIGEVVIIPRSAVALGTVTRGKPKGRMGKGGKLDINIDSVRLASNEKIALRAVKEMKGGGHTGAMTGAMVATGILFFPAAPFFLFMKGKDITIPKGTEITAYVNGDIPLDSAKFTPSIPSTLNAAVEATPASNSVVADSSTVLIKSAPDGAEILVDGKFAGSTPSTLQIKSGEHTIAVKKSGYGAWERTLTFNAGAAITLDAALEKVSQ